MPWYIWLLTGVVSGQLSDLVIFHLADWLGGKYYGGN